MFSGRDRRGDAKEGRTMKAGTIKLGWMGWALVLAAAAGIVYGGALLGAGAPAGQLAAVVIFAAWVVTQV
jgi:hypothetical protein